MLPLLLAFGSVCLTVVVGFCFLMWVVNEHLLANKYRTLAKAYQEATKDGKPLASGWEVTYKVGRATKTARVEGKTEGEVLKAFMMLGTGYTSIVSIVR